MKKAMKILFVCLLLAMGLCLTCLLYTSRCV